MEAPFKPRLVHSRIIRKLTPEEGAIAKQQLAQLAKDAPLLALMLDELQHQIDRETTAAAKENFWKMYPHQLAHALDATRRCTRPNLALTLLTIAIQYLDTGSGIVKLDRSELHQLARAKEPGSKPRLADVSQAMQELVEQRVFNRYTSGRRVLWQLNPNIATRQTGAAAEAQQAQHGPVLAFTNDQPIG